MPTTRRAFGLAIVIGALCLSAQAGVIINGDFETTDRSEGVANGLVLNAMAPGQWDVFRTIPGWTTIDGDGIEIQYNSVVAAHSPSHYVELDSHPHDNNNHTNSTMQQVISLTPGAYLLSFWYRPRTDALTDNRVEVTLDSLLVPSPLVADGISSQTTDWTKFSQSFTVTAAGSYTLKFAATGLETSLGGFIDDVAIDPRSDEPVPEPSTIILLGSALVALGALRRRKA